MSLEVELKLWVWSNPAGSITQKLAQCWQQLGLQVQTEPTVTLLNAYFETPDLWFRRQDAGLRTRCKNGAYQQTIKLAGQQLGAAHIRPEYNCPCAGIVPELQAFPAEIWPAHTCLQSLQSQIQELFRTDFVRQIWVLTMADGSLIEAVFDQGEVIAHGQSQPILEIELELLSGKAQHLFDLAKHLMRYCSLTLGFQSKAERGYRLAQQQPLTWLPSHANLTDSQLLRQFQQNLWLFQCQTSELLDAEVDARQQTLAQQWQALTQRLDGHSADPFARQLQQRCERLTALPNAALVEWLLDYSYWLYLQSTRSRTEQKMSQGAEA